MNFLDKESAISAAEELNGKDAYGLKMKINFGQVPHELTRQRREAERSKENNNDKDDNDENK